MPATRSRTRTVQTSPHEIQKVQRGDLQLLNDEEIKRYAARALIDTDLSKDEIIDQLFKDRQDIPRLIHNRSLHLPVVESNVMQDNNLPEASTPQIQKKADDRSYNPHKPTIAIGGRRRTPVATPVQRETTRDVAEEPIPQHDLQPEPPQPEPEQSTSQPQQRPRPPPLARTLVPVRNGDFGIPIGQPLIMSPITEEPPEGGPSRSQPHGVLPISSTGPLPSPLPHTPPNKSRTKKPRRQSFTPLGSSEHPPTTEVPVIDAQDIPTTQPGAPLSDSEVECAELDEQGNDAADDCDSEDAKSSECDQTPFEEGEPNEQFEWLDDKFVPRSLEWPPTAPFHPKDPHYIEKMMKVVHESRVQLVGVYDSVRKEIVDALVDAELAELELERQSELTQELLNHISKVAGTNFTRHMFSWIQQDLKEEAEKDKREREAAEGTSEGSDDDGDPGNGPSGGHGYRDDSDGGGQHEDKENEHPSSRGSRHGTPPRRDPPGAGDRYDADVDSEESDSHSNGGRSYRRPVNPTPSRRKAPIFPMQPSSPTSTPPPTHSSYRRSLPNAPGKRRRDEKEEDEIVSTELSGLDSSDGGPEGDLPALPPAKRARMDPGPSILQTSTSTASREKSNKRVSFDAPTPKSSSPAAPSRSFRISVPGPSSKGKERLTLTRHSTGTSISSGSMPFGGLRNVDELGSASFSFPPPGASSTPLIERPERLMIQDRRRPNPLRRSGAAISLEHYRNRHPVDADEHSQSSTSSPSSARSRYSPIPPRRIDYNAIRRAAAEHEDVFGPSRASGSGTRRSSSPESQSEDQSDMEDQLDAEAQSAVAGPSNTQEVVLHRGAPPSVANLSNRPIGTINRTVRGNGMPRHARHVSPARRLEYRGQEEDRGIEEYQRKEEDRSELPSLISFRMPRMPTYHDRSPEIALDGYAPFESEFGDAPIS